jgi:hypothetical protein
LIVVGGVGGVDCAPDSIVEAARANAVKVPMRVIGHSKPEIMINLGTETVGRCAKMGKVGSQTRISHSGQASSDQARG